MRPVPFVNVRKLLPLVAVHAHPAGVVTVMLPLVAALEALRLVGVIEYVHATGTVN